MLLATRGLGKRYERGRVAVDALQDVSVEIDERAFVTVKVRRAQARRPCS